MVAAGAAAAVVAAGAAASVGAVVAGLLAAEGAVASVVAAAAGSASGSGSVAAGSVVGRVARVARVAAHPGERAACAKSHDLTAGLTEDAVIGLEAPQAPKRRLLPGANEHYCPTRGSFVLCDPRP